ncbi:MAG TPA: hypothetical protein VMV44_05965 [Rectinemataceae bacterium]|nr:hypothetical protein [Rectinemataceae bacterium]
MSSKRLLVFAVSFFLIVLGVSAVDFAPYGFSQTGTRNVEGIDYAVLGDQGGGEVLFSQSADPTVARLQALKAIVSMLRSWDGLTISSIRATNDAAQLMVTAMPSSLLSGTTELAKALPGGLVFWYDGSIDYDFRIMSGNYAVRMVGLFTTSADLLGSMAQAYADPETWLMTSDPTFAIKQSAAIGARVAVLEASISRLQVSLMTVLNSGTFTTLTPVSQAAIDWVSAKKAANPSMKKADLAAAAKKEKVQVSDKELGIILLVKFGER